MEKEFYEEVAKRCLDSGTPIHYLVRDIREAVAHEAMIRSGGILNEASRSVGVEKATFSSYLGMGSREWNEKNGDKE